MEQSMQEKLALLRERQPSNHIAWRVGAIRRDATKGQAVPYLKARYIRDLLDSVFGLDSWRNSFSAGPSNSVICALELKVDGEWIRKSDGSTVDAHDPTNGMDEEFAIKGAYDSAFIRTAAQWGIGRYLYDFPIPWVELKDGKFFAERPKLPAEFLPANEQTTAGASTPKADAPAPATRTEPPAPTPAVVTKVTAPAPAPVTKAPSPAPTPAPTPVAKAPAPTPVAKAPAPVSPIDGPEVDDGANQRASALVDAAVSATVSPAAANTEGFPPGLPEGLNAEQLKTVKGLIDKIQKPLPFAMLRNYIGGDKLKAAVPEEARNYLMQLLNEAEAKKKG